jgi:hypothetical protein
MFRPQLSPSAKAVRRAAPAGLILTLSAHIGCISGDVRNRFAAAVESYEATPFSDPSAPYADPRRALGPPDGRTVALGRGASLTVRFFSEIPNGPGPDLRVVEIGPDGAHARVAVSADGEVFRELKDPASDGGTTEYELDDVGLSGATFVRIRGMDDKGLDPGFDLDAVEALQ